MSDTNPAGNSDSYIHRKAVWMFGCEIIGFRKVAIYLVCTQRMSSTIIFLKNCWNSVSICASSSFFLEHYDKFLQENCPNSMTSIFLKKKKIPSTYPTPSPKHKTPTPFIPFSPASKRSSSHHSNICHAHLRAQRPRLSTLTLVSHRMTTSFPLVLLHPLCPAA